uniref:Uncharacterized protein n=1 Tax=Arundo donax TaxID=35708 RepID=A0A0A9BEM8_ARUDO
MSGWRGRERRCQSGWRTAAPAR